MTDLCFSQIKSKVLTIFFKNGIYLNCNDVFIETPRKFSTNCALIYKAFSFSVDLNPNVYAKENLDINNDYMFECFSYESNHFVKGYIKNNKSNDKTYAITDIRTILLKHGILIHNDNIGYMLDYNYNIYTNDTHFDIFLFNDQRTQLFTHSGAISSLDGDISEVASLIQPDIVKFL